MLLEVEAERREEAGCVLLARRAHKGREVVGEHERGRRVAADEVARVLEQRALRGRREVEEDRLRESEALLPLSAGRAACAAACGLGWCVRAGMRVGVRVRGVLPRRRRAWAASGRVRGRSAGRRRLG